MLSKGEKIFTLITNLLTFALCLLVVVPFGKTGISESELTFKVLLAPIAILVLFILNSYVKYVVNASDNKYLSFSTYITIFGYAISILAYSVIVMVRTGSGPVLESGSNFIFTITPWIVITSIMVVGAVLLGVLAVAIHRFVLLLSTKENLFFDIVLLILLIIFTSVMKGLLYKHLNVELDGSALQFIVAPALIVLALETFLGYSMFNFLKYNEKYVYVSREELIEKWKAGRDEVYRQAQLDILYNLYRFSKNELGIEETPVVEELAPVVEETPVVEEEPVVEEAPVVEEPAVEEPQPAVIEVKEEVSEEHVEKLSEIESKINDLMKAKEELEEVEEEAPVVEEPKVAYPPKEFKPTFAEMVKYAQNFEGVTYQGNAEGTNYKFFVGKKVFLILVDNPKDYRLTFLMDLPQASDYAQIFAFSKAKSPKSIYSFKLVSKGEFGEEEIKSIIKGSYEMVETIKERELAAKEAEKARKAQEKLEQKLAAMTEEQRVKYLERLAKKEAEAKLTPEEKAQIEADKLAEKARIEEEKAAAKAKAEEEKAAAKAKAEEEKAAAKAKAEEEKAAAKAKAEEEKAAAKAKAEEEKAAAKAEAEKAKQKARLEAQKAKEKEKAKAEAEKAKEKARLEAQKAKEKEKAKAEAEKAKEKARLEAQKAKEKEKLAAQKAKEKEKLAAQKAKEKEKEKLAAQKAKEKEKAKAEAQKAKEKADAEKAA